MTGMYDCMIESGEIKSLIENSKETLEIIKKERSEHEAQFKEDIRKVAMAIDATETQLSKLEGRLSAAKDVQDGEAITSLEEEKAKLEGYVEKLQEELRNLKLSANVKLNEYTARILSAQDRVTELERYHKKALDAEA